MNRAINIYISKINNIETKIKLEASVEMLDHIDLMISHFSEINNKSKASILNNAFGLLQGLFVGIDSLYNLVLSITKQKYYININQNPILRQLKFVRNDVVGHPTNRKYGPNGVGYSKIDLEDLNNEELSYTTFHFRRGVLRENKNKINFDKLIEAYINEKEIIIDQISDYINKDYKTINFSKSLKSFYLDITDEKIAEVRSDFIDIYGNFPTHRFLWRLELLKVTHTWDEVDKDLRDVIEFLKIHLALKLYKISMDLENKEVAFKKIPAPKIIREAYKAFEAKPYLRRHLLNLNDMENPYYKDDITFLIEHIDNEYAVKLLKYLQSLKDNKKIFLIGSLLKKYNNANSW